MTIVANPQQYKIPNWFLNRCETQLTKPTVAWSSFVMSVTALRSTLQAFNCSWH
jgi:hypothetical protein